MKLHHKVLSVLATTLVGSSVLRLPAADAQDGAKLPALQEVLSAMNQNSVKIPSFQVRSVSITVTSPQFWGKSDEKIEPTSLIDGKQVKIQRNLSVVDNGRVFLDQLTTRVHSSGDLQEHMKYWLDEDKNVSYSLMQRWDYVNKKGNIAQLEEGVPTVHQNTGEGIPFPDLGKMQMSRKPKVLLTRYLTAYNARVSGLQNFQDLSCIRLDWEKPAKGGYDLKGFVLVCPSRDYKELYKENKAISVSPANKVKSFAEITTVNELKKYGDSWVPSDVSYENQEFYENKEVRSLQQRFRVVDFQIDPDVGLFSPLFSPGTRVFTGTPTGGDAAMNVAGESIAELSARLRGGDFSPMKVEEPKSKE